MLEKSDFDMVNNLSIAVHVLQVCMLTSLSVEEILLPKYTTNFRGLPCHSLKILHLLYLFHTDRLKNDP